MFYLFTLDLSTWCLSNKHGEQVDVAELVPLQFMCSVLWNFASGNWHRRGWSFECTPQGWNFSKAKWWESFCRNRHVAPTLIWLVVCLPFVIFPEWSSQLTNIFQRGSNHQPVIVREVYGKLMDIQFKESNHSVPVRLLRLRCWCCRCPSSCDTQIALDQCETASN